MRLVAIATSLAVAAAVAAPASASLPRIRAIVVSSATGTKVAETTGAAPRPLGGVIADGRGGFFASGAHGVVRLRGDGTQDPAFVDADVSTGPLALARGVLVGIGPAGLRFLDAHSGAVVHPVLPLAPAGTQVFASSIAASGSQVFVVGSTRRGQNGGSQLAFGANAATGRRSAWHPVIRKGIATQVAVSGPVVYLAGGFETVGGAARCGLASVWAGTGAVRAWSSSTCSEETPYALLATPHSLFVGRLHGFLAVRADTGAKLTWSTRTSLALTALGAGSLALAGHTLYIATVADAQPVRIAGAQRAGYLALDTTTGRLLPWRVAVARFENGKAIAVSGTHAIVYGSFRA
jgi:hypothetical protein